MFRMINRRRREDARVDAFLAAIGAERATQRTDTVAFPRILLAGTVL